MLRGLPGRRSAGKPLWTQAGAARVRGAVRSFVDSHGMGVFIRRVHRVAHRRRHCYRPQLEYLSAVYRGGEPGSATRTIGESESVCRRGRHFAGADRELADRGAGAGAHFARGLAGIVECSDGLAMDVHGGGRAGADLPRCFTRNSGKPAMALRTRTRRPGGEGAEADRRQRGLCGG